MDYGGTDSVEQPGMTVGETRRAEQNVIATLRTFKIIEWLTDEMESYTLPKAIDQITSTSRFSAWLKKQKGGDNQNRGLEKISTGTDE